MMKKATIGLMVLFLMGFHAAVAETNLVAGELKILSGNFKFTEGPAADATGNVYFTDVRAEKIYTWSTDGKLELYRENTGGANGLYFNKAGNLYTTPETVQIFSPEGVLIEEIKTPNRPTNVTFGGKQKRTLFITARAHVYTVEMNVAGME